MLRKCRLIICAITLMMLIQSSFAAIVLGNPKGKVTLDFVYDYQCVHCHHMYPKILKLIDHNPDLKVRMMPVAILGHMSLVEATAAIAAATHPGKYQELTNFWMMVRPTSEKEVNKSLKIFGLGSKTFMKSMHSKMVEEQLNESMKVLGQDGTPVMVVYPSNQPQQSRRFVGSQKYQTINEVISHA
ncbi:DsbA family protein [Francisellaceae bacterium]|nr:DsbA family protein [Francisellaceae bacterium]